jgi:microcystin-dependent protein
MSVESATYINQLNTSYPAATDGLKEGDDHIRLIKSVLKNTFPNIDGPVTASSDELNISLPIGIITMWSGSNASIPTGWALCSGQTVARSDGAGTITTPDLRDRFVVGSGSTYTTGTTGGSNSASFTTSANGAHTHTATSEAAGSHNHSALTGSTSLSIANLPSHTHTYSKATGVALSNQHRVMTDPDAYVNELSQDLNYLTTDTGATGSGTGHTHSIGSDGSHTHNLSVAAVVDHTHTGSVDTRSPYFALAFIMKH